MNNIISGKIGENLANYLLREKGLKIIEQNYRNKIGEIDLIALDKDYIVFIEVKARRSAKFGLPCEAVNYQKINKIRNVATLYLKSKGLLEKNVRFDVIDILDGNIRHIENAF